MVDFRRMMLSDCAEVSRIDRLAFAPYITGKNPGVELPARTFESLEAYLQCPGSGGIVLEEGGQIVGYVFLHQWGSLGWFGPLGVAPTRQAHGYGKLLVEKAIEEFTERGVQEIGLETMVDLPANVGLYVACGFQPVHLVLDLKRPISAITETSSVHTTQMGSKFKVRCLDVLDKQFPELIRVAEAITGGVIKGLSYLPELELLLKYGFGYVLVLENNTEPLGIALVQTKNVRNADKPLTTVRGLAIKPTVPELEYQGLSCLLQEIYVRAGALGVAEVQLSVYSAQAALVRYLLKQEQFSIVFPYLRLLLNDGAFSTPAGGMEMSKWRG